MLLQSMAPETFQTLYKDLGSKSSRRARVKSTDFNQRDLSSVLQYNERYDDTISNPKPDLMLRGFFLFFLRHGPFFASCFVSGLL